MDEHLEMLKKFKFDKQLEKLNKKLKDKKVILYGTGILFRKIQSNYDLSKLNVIGISDKKYPLSSEGTIDLTYPIIPLDKIKDYKPDYILITTENSLPILFDFQHNVFKGTKIKIRPLIDKPFLTFLKEIL